VDTKSHITKLPSPSFGSLGNLCG